MKLEPARLERIRTWAARYVDARIFAGLSVLILQDGREVFFDAQGLRDIDSGAPFVRDTVARIYSMTKPVTSLALMTLVEEGALHLDAPLSRFLPEFGDAHALIDGASRLDQVTPCAPPTLHQLLTHRSGLSYAFNPGLVPVAMAERDLTFAPRAGTLAQSCAALAALPLAFEPGARWEYSVGIDVIGRVIEVVTGQSLNTVLRQRILEPLGMSETGFAVAASQADRFATLYTRLSGDAMDLGAGAQAEGDLRVVDDANGSPFFAPTCLSGGGGLVGTIDDYASFAEAMRTGGQGIVSPATAAFMMRNHLTADIASLGPASFAEQPMRGMGFGIGGAVVLDPAQSGVPGSVGDFSWGGMASTFFWIDPVHDITAVLFTQLSPSSATPARAELKALVQGALM
ncbi:serine hydrolase domain-containing protein [uncultured Tateyamaria sp.]|uniref:serine hydrolase domain-containing protein n=1 Tax=uncultured Tateyamaria sp. TaxID=455651 RepID=UPI002603ADB6|nr:serine hydrolase domain-containing protein [uncultured Tateyamaria sp.]